MSLKRAVVAGLGAMALAATMALVAVTPAAAAADSNCYAWRTLKFGDSGLHAVVEPGAPWHVRLGTDRNGYEHFEICNLGVVAGKARITINSNAHNYLTSQPDRRVTADGVSPLARDNWFLCALDAKWAEISFFASSFYLGRNSSGYLTTTSDTPNGNTLWRLSEFNDFYVPPC